MSAVVRESMALISASTEEGFELSVLEAKAEGLQQSSATFLHREFHSESSLFFSLDDDGTALARGVIDLCCDPALWSQLSFRGLALARSSPWSVRLMPSPTRSEICKSI